MSFKSWLIPLLSTFVGVGFTIVSFVTNQEVNSTHVQLLDYLLTLTLGSGAIGAANGGFKLYQDYKNKPNKTD